MKTKPRWILIAAGTGECCAEPHAFHRYVRGGEKAVLAQETTFKKYLERKGYDVSEVYWIPAIPKGAKA